MRMPNRGIKVSLSTDETLMAGMETSWYALREVGHVGMYAYRCVGSKDVGLFFHVPAITITSVCCLLFAHHVTDDDDAG